MGNQNTYQINDLRQFMVKAFVLAGVPTEDGAIVADNLLNADLLGISSHGVARFPVYLRRVQKGLVKALPTIKIDNSISAVINVDGDNGLGAVVTMKALEAGMNAAEQFGMAAVGVRNSNHFGTAGYYCNIAAQKGYVAILVTNGPPAIAPWGGKESYFGTNPIAYGFPRKASPNLIIDMATSTVARGKIIQAAKTGKAIPDNWALDKDGNPTTDAKKAMEGVLLPIAGPKGYALALAVEHMAGVLTGAGFGKDVAWQYGNSEQPANVGHLLILLKAEAFSSDCDYYDRMERFCSEIKSIPPAPKYTEIKLPGEREWDAMQIRLVSGIELEPSLESELRQIALELNLELAYSSD